MDRKQFTLYAPVAVSALLLAATVAFGQSGDGPPPPPPPMHGMKPTAANVPAKILAVGLGLSSDQTTRIEAVQKEFQDQMHSLMPPPPPMPGQRDSQAGDGPPPGPPQPDPAVMDEVKSLDEAASDKVKAVLTSGQKKALPSFLTELDSLGKVGIPPMAFADLNLTSSQVQQIEAISADQDAQVKAAIDSAKSSGDYSQLRTTMRSIHDNAREKVKALLTSQQIAAIQNMRPPRGGPQGDGPPPPGE